MSDSSMFYFPIPFHGSSTQPRCLKQQVHHLIEHGADDLEWYYVDSPTIDDLHMMGWRRSPGIPAGSVASEQRSGRDGMGVARGRRDVGDGGGEGKDLDARGSRRMCGSVLFFLCVGDERGAGERRKRRRSGTLFMNLI